MKEYILVTGASGFLGSGLCNDLLNNGYNVIGIGRKKQGFLNNYTLKHNNFKYLQIELKNIKVNLLKKFKIFAIIHLASMVEYASHDYHDYHDYTILPTLNIIKIANELKINKIVFSSTASIITKAYDVTNEECPASPSSNYGLAKFICEKLLEFASKNNPSLNIVIIRFPALYGINHLGGIIHDLTMLALQNKDIELFNEGKYLRNVMYVKDAIQALMQALKITCPNRYEIFMVGSLDSKNLKFITKSIIKELKSKSKIILSTKQSPNPFNAIIDTKKAEIILNIKPKTIKSGIKKYINDLLNNQKKEHV